LPSAFATPGTPDRARDRKGRCRGDRHRLNNWIDDPQVDAVVITGGTGLTGRGVTPKRSTV
jgi:molybdopterin biosynthesis enzyme MoaB